MATLQSQTTFTITAAAAYEERVELVLLPENTGSNVRRELHYPNNILPPLIYYRNPDKWHGFDTEPVTAPSLSVEKTLAGNKLARWGGYVTDNAVVEVWQGDKKTLAMTADFLRRLLEYYLNPPASGYITWYPKDRTTAGYWIEIEGITVDGAPAVSLDYLAVKGGYILGEVQFSFRIVGEVS